MRKHLEDLRRCREQCLVRLPQRIFMMIINEKEIEHQIDVCKDRRQHVPHGRA